MSEDRRPLFNIVQITHVGDDVVLRVVCPHCNRHVGIREDDGFCHLCLNEIEQLNIAAWTEYAGMKK